MTASATGALRWLPMGICHCCEEAVPDEELVEHMESRHPELGVFQRWPDGGLVIEDTAETPADLDDD